MPFQIRVTGSYPSGVVAEPQFVLDSSEPLGSRALQFEDGYDAQREADRLAARPGAERWRYVAYEVPTGVRVEVGPPLANVERQLDIEVRNGDDGRLVAVHRALDWATVEVREKTEEERALSADHPGPVVSVVFRNDDGHSYIGGRSAYLVPTGTNSVLGDGRCADCRTYPGDYGCACP